MSWDLHLCVDVGGEELENLENADWNYTHNTTPMLRKAGLPRWEMITGRKAKGVLNLFKITIQNLEADPEGYRAMNPTNGWGSFDRLLVVLKEIVSRMEECPNAVVHVSW